MTSVDDSIDKDKYPLMKAAEKAALGQIVVYLHQQKFLCRSTKNTPVMSVRRFTLLLPSISNFLDFEEEDLF